MKVPWLAPPSTNLILDPNRLTLQAPFFASYSTQQFSVWYPLFRPRPRLTPEILDRYFR